MDRYDPDIPPDASDWLALDEDERLILVEDYHRDARIPLQTRWASDGNAKDRQMAT
jgi:hypothetical protein